MIYVNLVCLNYIILIIKWYINKNLSTIIIYLYY